MRKLPLLLLVLMIPLALYAQKGTIVGKVTDAKTGEALISANVLIKGTTLGAASGMDGIYRISKVPSGSYTLRVAFIGYKMMEKEVQVTAEDKVNVDFALEEDVIFGEAINIVADRAKERETPVAFTNIRKEEMVQRLGSQDIPMVLNTSPSVYATMQGGGIGDARINVRGFNQRNIAIMVNGVPINDMENGWVYWSNWDGIADATSSIQIQRGLSAVNLSTPSIGGTMNIVTDPTALERGFSLRQEVGSGGFLKTTLTANSGLIDDKFAFNALFVRKTGDGVINKTWTDAWAYYFGASWNINSDNRLELYALGAPQRHGQNRYKQNIAVYSKSFAKGLDDYDPVAFNKYHEIGRKYNQNWAPVSSSYNGKQAWNEKTGDRHDHDFINERENFYHKPQINLNWFTKLEDDLSLYTVIYYSGGKGGSAGTYGKLIHKSYEGSYDQKTGKYYYFDAPWSWDWDATIAVNRDSNHVWIDEQEYTKQAGQSIGILRNSRNNQWTLGAISKANYKISDNLKTTFGIDWRTAEIEHYREVRDLLGGEYYIDYGSDFWHKDGKRVGLGDKIDYYFTNNVNWFGFFGQSEYSTACLTAYGMAGYSIIKYKHINHFFDDGTGNEVKLESDNISGYQIKSGVSYRLTNKIQLFGNGGYISKAPIFDAVINDRTAAFVDNDGNEQFTSFEGGANVDLLNGNLNLKCNLYFTNWQNRTLTKSDYDVFSDEEGIIVITGMDAQHFGVEFEGVFQPNSIIRFDAAASIGNWKNINNANALYKDYGDKPDTSFTIYVKDLKTGDAPQTQIALAGSVYPMSGLFAQLMFKYYANHYAAWNPIDRTNPNDRAQSWKAPNYYVMDLHAAYDLPFDLGGIKLQVFAHVFNLFDAEYIQDATDNSEYNYFDKDHDADDAEVFFGLPRTFNIGLQLRY